MKNKFVRKMKYKAQDDVTLAGALKKEYLIIPEQAMLDVVDKRLMHPWSVRVNIRNRDHATGHLVSFRDLKKQMK